MVVFSHQNRAGRTVTSDPIKVACTCAMTTVSSYIHLIHVPRTKISTVRSYMCRTVWDAVLYQGSIWNNCWDNRNARNAWNAWNTWNTWIIGKLSGENGTAHLEGETKGHDKPWQSDKSCLTYESQRDAMKPITMHRCFLRKDDNYRTNVLVLP